MKPPPTFIRLYLVENSQSDRMLIMELLRAYGEGQFIVCGIFRNLAELLAGMQESGAMDVVLLDLALPDSRGIGTYTRLASAYPSQPVVALCGYDDEPDAVEAVHLGAQDYLVKNELTGKLLISSLRYVVDHYRAETALKTLREELESKLADRTRALAKANQRLAEVTDELKTYHDNAADQERIRALNRTAGGLAHDFNNALSPILVHSEWLLHKPGVLGDETVVRNALEQINHSAEQCAEMVLRLRDFGRPCDGPPRMELLEIRGVIEQAIADTRPVWKDQAEARGCKIELQTDYAPAGKVHGIREQLVELFTDLIINAADAIRSSGIISVTVANLDDQHVSVCVADNGAGSLCDNGEAKSESGRAGRGMGLVYGVAQRHNAEVMLSSWGEDGTSVTIQFPVSKEETAPRIQVPKAEGLRILAVDDEPGIREILKLCLTEDGHEVVLAAEGKEALGKFKKGRFDLLLTDYSMPGKNGDSLAAAARAVDPKIRIALLTGFGSQMPQGTPLRLEVDAIIAKPFNLEALRQGIAEAMRG